jgi:oligopeptide/dipeptide ABC transporter ATP-binding protein
VPNSPSSFGRFINHVKKAEIVDPHTIRFTTADPFPLMATYMSGFAIVSKKHGEGAATKDYNSGKAMVGTGPFKFEEWIPGDRIVYTRNDEYWDEKPEWEKVVLKPISNSSARVAALLAGDADLIDFVPSRNKRGNALYQIPGMTPSLLNSPGGCAFRERCPRADTACLAAPEISGPLPGRRIRCFHSLHSEAS